jgi:hypothetical protein
MLRPLWPVAAGTPMLVVASAVCLHYQRLSAVWMLQIIRGTCMQVLIWNLGDHVTTLSAVGGMPSTAFPQSKLSPQTTLKVSCTLQRSQQACHQPNPGTTSGSHDLPQGHESTIEDVVFKPGSKEQLASVGDDQCLLLWDTRAGNEPAKRVAQVWLSNKGWTVSRCPGPVVIAGICSLLPTRRRMASTTFTLWTGVACATL